MLNKRAFFFLRKITLLLPVLLIFGCANRVPPQGGPRDHDPPKLLKATPPDMTRNFKGKVIQLDFDEFFKLSPISDISISPTPTKIPEYKIKQKSIVITLKDTLEKNTTYVINFGKAIADVNEGNVLKNFTYVFATGPHIDSLSISGKVMNTQTGEREKDATVMLFTLRQDSLLFGKKRPTIFATTDSAGNFTLSNLHPDKYRIYALKEPAASNKIYDRDEKLIAFSKKIIHLTTDTSNVELRLFKAEPEKFKTTKRFDADGKMFFTFNKSLDHPALKVTYPPDFDKYKVVDISKTKDTATLFMRNMDFDSIRIAFFDGTKPLDTTYLKKSRKEAFTRLLSFKYDINADNKLRPATDLTIKANLPIDSFDPALISLKEDSTDVTNFTIERDTANPMLFILKNRWKQIVNYTLTIGEDAFTDIYGDKNKRAIPRRFNIDKPENYSMLTLKVTVPDTGKAYIVELLNESKQVLRQDIIRKNSSIVYKSLITGKYNVRVIYDDNNNGKWDSGNVKLKRQPENIWVNETLIPLRPNWEQETPINIPKEPTTP